MPSITSTLGYGEYASTDFWGMLSETLPFFLQTSLPALGLYAVASFVIERTGRGAWGVIVFVAGTLLFVVDVGVMGAWGPAHVGLNAGLPAWPMFLPVLLVKALLRSRSAARAGAPTT